MPRWLRNLLLLLTIVWIGVVYTPDLRGGANGFLGSDLLILADAAGGPEVSAQRAEPLPLQEMSASATMRAGGQRGSILTGASLALSRRLWGVADTSSPLYRLENLLLLLAAGLGLANFVRRLLLPWTGAEHARAAARALPAVLFLHPLAVHTVGDLAGRAELLYMALGAWAAATWLRGRQDRSPSQSLAALALLTLASLAGRFGPGLPLVLAIAEFVSVKRYQPRPERLRRALLALLVLLVAAAPELILRQSLGMGPLEPLGWMAGAGSPLERFGVLVLPVPLAATGWTGLSLALAATLFLASMHPALRAARWAPRLWGWLLGGWFAALLLATVGGGRVSPSDFSAAETLFPAAAILVSGLVVVATGVQGFRRLFLPVALAIGFGALSLNQSGHHMRAAHYTAGLRADLLRAGEAAEQTRTELASQGFASLEGPAILVIEELPGKAGVLDPIAGGIGHLLDASLTGKLPSSQLRRPKLLTEAAFIAFAREPEFAALREGGVVLLLPEAGDEPGRRIRSLGPPRPLEAPPAWRGDASSPELNLDPLRIGALRALPPAERLSIQSPLPDQVSFRPRASAAEAGASGVWGQRLGRTEGLFDLSSELDWLLAERIGRMWFATGLPRVETCEFLAALPGRDEEPAGRDWVERSGSDWIFPVPSTATELVSEAEESWVLGLLDLGELEHIEFEVDGPDSGRLVFADVERLIARWEVSELAWTLERRAGGRTIWRHQGRLP